MRVATSVPGSGASAEAAPSAAAAAFGRRKPHQQQARGSPAAALSGRGRRAAAASASASASASAAERDVSPVAALAHSYLDAAHAQSRMNFDEAEAMPAPSTIAMAAMSISGSAAPLSAAATVAGLASSRTGRLQQREKRELALLHRAAAAAAAAAAPPSGIVNDSGGTAAVVVSPSTSQRALQTHSREADTQSSTIAVGNNGGLAASYAALPPPHGHTHVFRAAAHDSSTTSLSRLFHSQSRQQVQTGSSASQGSLSGRARSAAPSASLSSDAHSNGSMPTSIYGSQKHLQRIYNGLNISSQSSLLLAAALQNGDNPTHGGGGGGGSGNDSQKLLLSTQQSLAEITDGSYSNESDVLASLLSGRASHAYSSTAHLREFDESLQSLRPKLLSDLEAYLASEMRKQHLSDRDAPSLPRFMLYREVLLRFIHGFFGLSGGGGAGAGAGAGYRSILCRVLREFEALLEAQDRALATLPPTQAALATIRQAHAAEQAEAAAARARLDAQRDAELEALRTQMASLRSEALAATQARDVATDELASLKASHAQLLQSHSTLKSALTRASAERSAALEASHTENELSRKLGARLAELQGHQEALLKELSLLRSHAQESAKHAPQDYASLLEQNLALTQAAQEAQTKYQSRSAEYFQILDLYESLVQERKQMAVDKELYENMKRVSTPRPQWKRVSSHTHTHTHTHTHARADSKQAQ